MPRVAPTANMIQLIGCLAGKVDGLVNLHTHCSHHGQIHGLTHLLVGGCHLLQVTYYLHSCAANARNIGHADVIPQSVLTVQ